MNEPEENRANDGVYVENDVRDLEYFGAARVIEEERKQIRIRRGLKNHTKLENLTGLALSGGGIRSASFSLGIMQALAYRGWLKKIDYLSTVSGGGYIGSSLIWLLKSNTDFGMERDNFPYASFPMSSQPRTEQPHTSLKERIRTNPNAVNYKGKLLRFVRQNAKYLNPGRGINLFSLAGLALRGGLAGILVYGGLATLVLWVFKFFGAFDCSTWEYLYVPEPLDKNFFFALLFWVLVAYLASIPIFALITIFSGNGRESHTYGLRRGYEIALGYLLPSLICLAILGSLPIIRCSLLELGQKTSTPPAAFTASGQRTSSGGFVFSGHIRPAPVPKGLKPADQDPCCITKETPSHSPFLNALRQEMGALGAGLCAMLMALVSGLGAFFKTGRLTMKKLPLGPLVAVGITLLVIGQLLTSFSLLQVIDSAKPHPAFLLMTLVLLLVLASININYLSLHRFYRDRLMETFMPNTKNLLERHFESAHIAKAADQARLHTMGILVDDAKQEQRHVPYHIINTNVVLVSSNHPKFRGRGGDCFILSPAFCGSNATGWRATSSFMQGTMTLATAMAISGAAVNPSAGCGGEGITRSPFLSALMGMLNLRLGYWVPNPDNRKGFWKRKRIPTSILPGLSEISLRFFLNEKSRFLQLSDGGHFENLGLYELIRRKLRLIIVCDGGADPNFTFSELSNAMEKARSDFGALIMLESEHLALLTPNNTDPQGVAYAQSPYLLAKIAYSDGSEGRLIYITTNFFKELSADLYGYRKEHPAFPDEPTTDQFFDEKQFEAYRELGFQAAWAMMKGEDIAKDGIITGIMN